jgi:hypothetical protein
MNETEHPHIAELAPLQRPFAHDALAAETGPAEHRGRRGVACHDGGFHPVQRHLLEAQPQHGRDRLGHQAATPVVPGQVVPEDGEVAVLDPAGVAAGADDPRRAGEQQPPADRLPLTELPGRAGREFVALLDPGEGVPRVVLGDLVIGEDAEQRLAVRLGDLAQHEPLGAQHRRVGEDVRRGHGNAVLTRSTCFSSASYPS